MNIEELARAGEQKYLRNISVDCVVFGFHNNQLKVLLLRLKQKREWGLPGGFVMNHESMEVAATRILHERTGLNQVFLQQFHVFSDPERTKNASHFKALQQAGFHIPDHSWLFERFISVGFYALVDFSKVTPTPDILSEDCAWWDLKDIHTLMLDHSKILNTALETLRLQISFQPIGYNLLPKKFTMPELQTLYETILGRKLDRRNFQRKMLSYCILDRLEETKQGGAHKAPFLYRFNLKNYNKALKEGLKGNW